MPQRKQLTWTELRVGLFVMVGMFVLAVGVFYVTSVGVWAPKYRLKTYLPEVSGLTVGAPVRLDGVEIGNVDAIHMTPRQPGAPFERRRNIEIVMRINKRFQSEIRSDSAASLITEGLLGNRYVNIERGITGAPLGSDQEVPGREEKAIKQIVERGADLVQNLNALSEQAREIVDGVQRGRGSLGKFLVDETAYNRLNSSLGRIENVVASVEAGRGTLGKLVASDEVYQKVNSAAGRLDTVLADVHAQKGTLGKLIYDSAMHDSARQFLERGNTLMGDVRAGKGTLGKLATDESLYAAWRDTGANLKSATAKLNDNQTTAGKFFTDPRFYDNVSGLAGDTRLLIGDFRQNPKKFLHVKFSIF